VPVHQVSKAQAGIILRRRMDKRYRRHPEYNVGDIRDIVIEDDQIVGALVDISGEIAVVDPPQGRGMDFMIPGMQWRMKREAGDVLGSKWSFDICLTNPVGNAKDTPAIYLPVPQVQASTLGGFRTHQGRSAGDPGGPIQAALTVFPRSTWLGLYTLYDWKVSHTAIQYRIAGSDQWAATAVVPLMPPFPVHFTLASDILANTTTIPITLPASGYDQVPADVPLIWRIGGEVINAVWNGITTLTVVQWDGASNSELGLGFVADPDGRGRPDGEDGASVHAAGTDIELLNTQATVLDLSPGTAYQFRVCAVASSGRQGPWGDIVSFTSWAETTPPLAPANLLVDQLSTGIKATWSAVNQDEAGKPRADVKRYAVLRATANLGAAFAIATYGHQMTEAQLATAVAAQPANTVALYDTRLQATSVLVPEKVGNGNYIGIAAIDYSGNWSDWAWQQDNVAPPYPNPAQVIMYEVEEGISYKVPESSSSFNSQNGSPIASPAHRDPGFKQYALLVAGDANGGGAAVAGYGGPGSSGVIPINGGVTGYYKLVAVDSAGNMNNAAAPNNHGFTTGGSWKLIFSRYAELGLPPNGNFQVPNQTGADAKGWTRSTLSVPATSGYYDTGGKEGNKVYRWDMVGGYGYPGSEQFVVYGDIVRIIPASTGAGTAEMWVYQNSGTTRSYLLMIGLTCSSDDNGVLNDAGSFWIDTNAGVNIPSGVWTRVQFTHVSSTLLSNARSGYYFASIRPLASINGPTNYSVYMDALKMTFS